MARSLGSLPRKSDNGPGHNSGVSFEKPYFDRLLHLRTAIAELRDDIKELKIECKEADIDVGPLELAVKRYRETEEERLARETKEAEAERILRACLGDFIETDLGGSALNDALDEAETKIAKAKDSNRRRRKVQESMDAARAHLGSEQQIEDERERISEMPLI